MPGVLLPSPEVWDRLARWADLRERTRLVELVDPLRVQPVVVVASLEEAPYRKNGMQFAGLVPVTAVAGQNGLAGVLNLTRSNLVVDLVCIEGPAGATQLFDVGPTSVTLANLFPLGSAEGRLQGGQLSAPIELRGGTAAGNGIFPGMAMAQTTSSTGAFQVRELRGPFVIAPGQNLAVGSRAVNVAFNVTFLGRFWEDVERRGAAR